MLSAASATVGDIIKSLLPGSPEYVVPPLQSNNNNPGAIRNSQYKQVLRRPELGMSATTSVEVRVRRGRPVSSIRSLTNICIFGHLMDGMTTVMGTIATSSLVYHLVAGTQCHRSITAALLTSILFLNNVMLLTRCSDGEYGAAGGNK